MARIVLVVAINALRDTAGVSATEYTLMVVGMAAVVLAGWSNLGNDISAAISSIGDYLVTATAGL